MRVILFVITLLTGLSAAAQVRTAVTITKISDGDTFWATDESGTNIKFRPIGFDCPEESNFGRPAEPFNEEATAYTASLIENQTVFVEYDVELSDQWGRHLVYVFLSDGRMLNEEVLLAGWARVATYPPNVKYVERFVKAQKTAIAAQRGMWSK